MKDKKYQYLSLTITLYEYLQKFGQGILYNRYVNKSDEIEIVRALAEYKVLRVDNSIFGGGLGVQAEYTDEGHNFYLKARHLKITEESSDSDEIKLI